MLTTILSLFLILAGLYRIYSYMIYRPPNFPPGRYKYTNSMDKCFITELRFMNLLSAGPPRIPFFGSYLLMLLLNRHHLQIAANVLAKWYRSNIVGLYLGGTPAIILTDTEKVGKALNAREFDGKPDILAARLRDPNFNLHGECEPGLSL